MKIDQPPVGRVLPGQQTQPEGRAANTGAPAPGAASDATGISHLRAGLQDGSQDIDAARIAEIRQAIADGTLTINPEKIAAGLIASLQQELQQDS